LEWRYILFHHKHHPEEMGVPEIEAFLSHLAITEQVAASTQNQALSALFFSFESFSSAVSSGEAKIAANMTAQIASVCDRYF
jgi:Phage integrase, N-terminal SAM-like domain